MILLAVQDPRATAKGGEDQKATIMIRLHSAKKPNSHRFGYDHEEKMIDHHFCRPSLFSIFDVLSSSKT
jgi:hypothetical protein